MKEIESFKKKYRSAMEKKGLKVGYFGSTRDSWKWERGRSDLDIFVYGNNIPPELKARGVLLVRDLNDELGLKLENVPFAYWTPIYIDSPRRIKLKELSEKGILRYFIEQVRKLLKGSSRIWWPITYNEWWRLVKLAYRYKESPLPLPPPCPSIPPAILLKLL